MMRGLPREVERGVSSAVCATSRDVLEVGQVVSGKYRLLRLLGDGGMGAVYEAEHLTLGTRVAIKVLHPDLARRSGIAERFLQEARVSAQIRSPHVVQVIDVDRTPEGVAYLVMELLEGEPLSGAMKRRQRLDVATACEYTAQILSALEAAHALGVIHRDLKPDNVFVTFQGGRPVLKLIDFGIAKVKTPQEGQTKNLTVAGMLMGTPEYMAPEQAYSADKVDVRADLYAVGVMLYEMLSGQSPATADDPRVLVLKVERGEVTPLVQAAPGIEPPLAGFVHRAMAPRPELRFASATEMRVQLEEIRSGKRAGTAKLTAVNAGSPAPAPSAPALGEVRSEGGTGTVMGAPAPSAMSHAPLPVVAASLSPVGPGGTAAAPPVPTPRALSPSPAVVMTPPQGEVPRRSSRRGGAGGVLALAVVALLLGAGAVVAYVMSTQPLAPVPVALPTLPTTPPPTTTSTAPIVPVSTSVTPVTPLTTSTAPLPPAPTPRRDAGGGGQAQRDAGAPPVPVDAGSPGQTTIVTPFGTFQFPGPRPPFYPPDQPWPPANMGPLPLPPQ
jgi:serine/threonine-protein kinase